MSDRRSNSLEVRRRSGLGRATAPLAPAGRSWGEVVVMKTKGLVRTTIDSGLAEVAGNIVPGGSTAIELLRGIFSRKARARAQELFEGIASALEAPNADAAASMLAEHAGEAWLDESVEAGFFELMECVDPVARRCIAFLVAEFVAQQRSPDVRFRRAGTLLRG